MSNNSWQLKVFPILSILGFLIIMIGFIIGLIVAGTSNAYYGENTKTDRDEANVGDKQQDQLVQITSTPRWLEPLIFLGVAAFMTGIALEFSTIPALLRQRGQAISSAFGKLTGGS